ncbi:MAG: hypothetical protein C0429_09550 [Sphingopyxis sp.]|nr:hypothetical protein [Sphingopyxis sp.]
MDRRYLVLGMGALAAVAVGVTSFAIANQTRKPAVAMAVGVPPQGLAKAGVARALYGSRLVKNPKARPGAPERRLAERAFAAEPLAANALPILIAGLAADGDQQRSQALLQLAGKVTRRDRLINAMLIDEELPKNRPDRVIKLFDRAMAVSTEVRSFYLERLATATLNPAAIQALAPMLGRAPDWADEYWAAALRFSQAVPQVGELRLRITRPPWNQRKPLETDALLVSRLVESSQYDIASDLARALGLKTTPGDSLVNPDFSQVPRFSPVDWEMMQSGEIGVSIDPAKGSLLLSSLPSSSGVAVRQITALTPGRYQLSWKLAGLKASPGAELRYRLSCTDPGISGGKSADSGRLAEGVGSQTINLPASPCRWYWFEVELDATNVDSGVDITLDQLSFQRQVAGSSRPARLPARN